MCSRIGFHRALIVALLALGLLALPRPAEAQKVLRYKYQKGEARQMEIAQNMAMSINAGDRIVEMKMNQNMVMLQTVEDVDAEGVSTIGIQIQQIKMKMEGAPEASFDYDSTKKEAPTGPVAQLLGPLLGAMTKGKVVTKVTSQGKALDVAVPQEWTNAIAAGGLPGLGEMFSKDGFGQLMKQNSATFPEGTVKPGDSWSDSIEVKAPVVGKQTVKTTYTYEGEEVVEGKKLDRLGVVIEMQFGDGEGQPAVINVKEQSAKGFLRFDNDAGQLVDGEINQNMKMEVNVAGNALTQDITNKTVIVVKPAAQ